MVIVCFALNAVLRCGAGAVQGGSEPTQSAVLEPMMRHDRVTPAEIALPRAVGVVISNGLSILATTADEEMR